MLRSTLLNAYGWRTVPTIAPYAGYVMVVAGILMGIPAVLGFRHGRKVTVEIPETPAVRQELLPTP